MVFKRFAGGAVAAFTRVPSMDTSCHMVAGFCIRLLFILYGDIQDWMLDVKYTDVDYKVFTDAARHVVKGESPYDRHTYRYSPIIAWLMVPNVILYDNFGKILFSFFDILIGIVIKACVSRQLNGKIYSSEVSKYSALFWLYNPLSIVISTRGNADSFSCFFILASVFFLRCQNVNNSMMYVLSGTCLGLAIHMRIYPLIFAFPMYLYLGNYKITRNTSISMGLRALLPNKKQILFLVSMSVYFFTLTYVMYMLYGEKFLFETYVYHLFRKDTRHNFSVFFYTSYLTMTDVTFDLIKFTARVFLSVILFFLSVAFGHDSETLPFALFCQAAVLVIYNSVVTSQYFIWFLSLLPLIIKDVKASVLDGILLTAIWTSSQCFWLFYAYLLEFFNQEVYIVLWIMCIFFFGSNIAVLYQIIKLYTPGYSFGWQANGRAKTK